ncbi:hypothetical protein A2U01_0052778 [Trifolium medium]|uniref:Uncharacterized protein n=1 Tax=Trifolium medium TaxID=97028 RepID=A0A392R6S5_9FABA|nr:hypothetical protein [Trifolium medium]
MEAISPTCTAVVALNEAHRMNTLSGRLPTHGAGSTTTGFGTTVGSRVGSRKIIHIELRTTIYK